MYDAADRRFLAKDLIKGTISNPLTLVPYTYVLDNPLKYVDSLGLDAAIDTMAEEAIRTRLYGEEPTPNVFILTVIFVSDVTGSTERYKVMTNDPSLYSIANFGSSGIVEVINRAVNPEKPFSLDHWVASVETAAMFFPAFGCGEKLTTVSKVGGNSTKFLSEGAGKLSGSLDGLTVAERTVVNDLLSQGKNVQIVSRSNVQGVATPDFVINGVKTELKTITGTSLNTPVTRIQDGFKQGAQSVIIDARNSGLTVEQANQVLDRAAGTYANKTLPGQVEIWTNEGIISR
jgi:hypothetical protein